MKIFSQIGGLNGSLLATVTSLVASVVVSCGQVSVKTTASDDAVLSQNEGLLNLTADSFPEGAEKLKLTIRKTWKVEPMPCVQPLPVLVEEGSTTTTRDEIYPCAGNAIAHETATQARHSFPTELDQVIFLNKGEKLKPIKLKSGSYQAEAEFFDASGQLVYSGSEVFALAVGEKKSLKIQLQKHGNGTVNIGFVVDKPVVKPTNVN